MRVAVIRFPGSNSDQDCVRAVQDFPGASAEFVWHKDASLSGFDAVIVPGGFSYGDYLRCGAIARFSPVMAAVKDFAGNGGLVLGICNGFQILCETGLLPGALVRNRDLHFLCEHVHLRVENADIPFTRALALGTVLRVPIAHGEGCYFADDATIEALESSNRVVIRYCDASGAVTPESNPNGSRNNIAGICNATGNVFGLMPHPERACDPRLGSVDGRAIFNSLLAASPRLAL